MDENTMIGMNDTEYDEFVAGSAAETIKRLGPVRKIDIREFLDNFDLQFFADRGDAPFFVTVNERGVERVNKGLLAAYCRKNLAYVIIKELDGTAFKYVSSCPLATRPPPVCQPAIRRGQNQSLKRYSEYQNSEA